MANEKDFDELQDLAFQEAHDNPFTDEQLQEALAKGDAWVSTGDARPVEDFEAAAWDAERKVD